MAQQLSGLIRSLTVLRCSQSLRRTSMSGVCQGQIVGSSCMETGYLILLLAYLCKTLVATILQHHRV